MDHPIISADSHITEPPNTYLDFIEPAFRDRAPRMREDEKHGAVFVIDNGRDSVPMGLTAAAGKRPEEITVDGVAFADLHPGGWDPKARLAEQDRDGIAAEILYPTVGMLICNHPDFDYKHACFQAYNRWITEYCGHHPGRLLGVGQTAMRSPREGIRDLERIRELGLRGVMLPGYPAEEDYDSPIYDDFWRAAIELEIPVSFHILTDRPREQRGRGPAISFLMWIIRGCQDIMAMLVMGGVFERIPRLRVVCVEADAGWAPHFMYRLDHNYQRHRFWLHPDNQLQRLPSEYFREHIYLTFQDDWTAFASAHLMNADRLMWANDFPHSDSTWPCSQELLAKHTAGSAPEVRERILYRNVAELYGIELPSAAA